MKTRNRLRLLTPAALLLIVSIVVYAIFAPCALAAEAAAGGVAGAGASAIVVPLSAIGIAAVIALSIGGLATALSSGDGSPTGTPSTHSTSASGGK